MSTTSKSNATHRKRLARAFAERSGRPYAQALDIVTRAADAGRLPEPLDGDGMARAIEALMAVEPAGDQRSDTSAGCHAARTGEGYWTCDVPGGCADCRHLAAEIDDIEQIASWDAERRGQATEQPSEQPGRSPSLYLIPSFLLGLRQVWQGRVTKEPLPRGGGYRFTLDNKPATAARDIEFFLLERDGYIEGALLEGEEWAAVRTTPFGDQVLAANGADVDKFYDGLPKGVGRLPTEREPYVGRGADGARRSAQIDREEADGLDKADPRYAEVLASAEQWEQRAARIEQETAARDLAEDRDAAAFVERVHRMEAGLTAVNAALAAVEKEPFSADEGGRRKASSAADQRIWDLSWVYEHLTGSQGLVYISSPGSGADRYVFGGHHTALGRAQALEHITGLVETLRLRDDLTWPPVVRTGEPRYAPEMVNGECQHANVRFTPGEGTSCADCGEALVDDLGPSGFGASGAKAVQAALDRRASRDANEVPGQKQADSPRVTWLVAHEGNDVDRCTGSSWRDKASKRDPHGYGPGGYNRCVKAAGHDPADGGHDPHHVDEWGHIFLLHPAFRVVRRVDNDEMAAIAREAGMHVSDGSDMRSEPTPPRPNTLWVTGGKGAKVEIVRVSALHEDDARLTAQVVHPVPSRTTVRSYPLAEGLAGADRC